MEIKIYPTLKEIPSEQWKAVAAGPFPFSDYPFLWALESSHCVGPGTGWTPYYLTAWEGKQLAGAVYLYEREDSVGEFIFDWQWAEAYAQYGLSYYPKLVSAVPFTPATGAKLLLRPGADAERIRGLLVNASLKFAEQQRVSGLHFLFIPPEEVPCFEQTGLLIRHSYQFHWENNGYADFAEFLSALKHKRRQQIATERRRVEESGVELVTLTGPALHKEHGRLLYQFSSATFLKKNGSLPYLSERFFEEIFETMPEQIILFLAREGGHWVAAAIHFRQGDHLFGRYWGCFEEIRYLQFELCYYRAIEYANENRIQLFEAGAQGPHKVPRGFFPRTTYSAHWIKDAIFRDAIGRFIEREKQYVAEDIRRLQVHLPYRSAK